FSEGWLEYPQYTRPVEFQGMKVPDILCSGNHRQIAEWRAEQSVQRTRERRPDMAARKDEEESQEQGNGNELGKVRKIEP
ncbi:MAG: tRNA (guanosine(37)-N1)-methyltransferase TrmD, partial [Lentisphaerota bacterium]